MSFKFGDITHKSLGTMQKSIPTPNGNNMTFRCDIISADNPVLLGLDLMATEGLNSQCQRSRTQTYRVFQKKERKV